MAPVETYLVLMMRKHEELEIRAERPLATAPAGNLVKQAVQTGTELVRKEIELARAEVKDDIRREISAAKGLVVAAMCALTGLNLTLIAVALALAAAGLPEWAAALIVAAVVLAAGAVAGLVGWRRRVQKPLERTQRILKEDVQWTRELLA
jgi:hypothetical protein